MTYYIPLVEKHDYFCGWTTVPGELLTEQERNRRFRYLSDNIFVRVSISRRKTYKINGVRFPYQYESESLVIYHT